MKTKTPDPTIIVEWNVDQQTSRGKVKKGELTGIPKSVVGTFLARGLCFVPESVSVMYIGNRGKYEYRYKRKKYVFIQNLSRIIPAVVARELKFYKQAFVVRPLGYSGRQIRPTAQIREGEPDERIELNQHYIISYNGNFGDVLRAACLAETLYGVGFTVSFRVKKQMVELFENNPHVISKPPKGAIVTTLDLDKIRVHKLESQNILRTTTWLKEIGLEDSVFRKPSYFPTSAELEYADRRVKKDKFSIGLGTGSSVPGKTWPGFNELANQLRKNNHVIILDRIVTGAYPGSKQFRYTLRQVGAIISRCDLVVTNDSLLLHLAGAVDTPCVGLFGNTNSKCMIQSYPFCVGLQGKCKLDKPPCWYALSCGKDYFSGALPCVEAISVDTVMQAINKTRS